MSDSLLTAAMLGTERHATPGQTIPEVESLLNEMPETSLERRLLLAAGAQAIYRQAGMLPEAASDPLPKAAQDTLPECSPLVQALVRDLLEEPVEHMLRMVFERMERAGVRLPHDLLADALYRVKADARPALLSVLDERGHWLARFNPVWSWVATESLERNADRLPPDAETIWQEGTLAPRVKLVALHRRLDPVGALERVRGVFRSEGAEARAKLVSALETGLSPIDEPFLEEALDDRSEQVRREAASLLARLPESAYVERMRRRADEMLSVSTRQRVLTSRRTVEVRTPDDVDQSWKRDRLDRKPAIVPYDTWLWRVQRVVASVPVRYWLDRFDITIDDLVSAPDEEWRPVLLEAWTDSALLYKEWELMPALWDAWLAMVGERRSHQRLVDLTRAMRATDLEPRLVNLLQIRRPDQGVWYWALLAAAPSPWGARPGEEYLRLLGKAVGVSGQKIDVSELSFLLWHEAGRGLPDGLIDRALALLSLVSSRVGIPPETWQRLLNVRREWQMRQRIFQALPE